MLALAILTTVLVGYFAGNLNGAVIISCLFRKEDVRTKGSGNAGATNYYRNYGKKGAVPVLLIDMGKAALAAYLGLLFFRLFGIAGQDDLAKMLGGFAAVLGHMFPLLLHFRGGKGILSAATLMLVMDWRMFLIAFALFLIVFAASHYVSLASILAAVSYCPIFLGFYWGQWWIIGMSFLLSVLAIYLHRSNISRLLHGTESKTYLRHKH